MYIFSEYHSWQYYDDQNPALQYWLFERKSYSCDLVSGNQSSSGTNYQFPAVYSYPSGWHISNIGFKLVLPWNVSAAGVGVGAEWQVGAELRWHNSGKAPLRHGWPRYHLQASAAGTRIAGAHPSRFYSHNCKLSQTRCNAMPVRLSLQNLAKVLKMLRKVQWEPMPWCLKLLIWFEEVLQRKESLSSTCSVCRSGSREDKSWMIHWFFSPPRSHPTILTILNGTC